ncbi:BrnT family toxin [Stenotrophomonas sp.]|uniref:BrnT family toxin n=1 Tax=Stenotrophomonas sp. TaxID=69392 RepID=UPI002FC672B3
MNQIPENMGLPNWEFRVVVGRTRIDYDTDKEYGNREKHGYSLESAVTLLESTLLPIGAPPFITSDGFMEAGEVRHMHMAVDDCGKVVLMVTTMRRDETVRVISFRRASAQEREQFHSITGFLEAAVDD